MLTGRLGIAFGQRMSFFRFSYDVNTIGRSGNARFSLRVLSANHIIGIEDWVTRLPIHGHSTRFPPVMPCPRIATGVEFVALTVRAPYTRQVIISKQGVLVP